MALSNIPPFSQCGKVVHGTVPGLPKIRDQTKILSFFQDGSIEFPQAWTGGNGVRNRDGDLDPAVIRKRTGHHGAGRDERDPLGRNTDQVDARGESAIPFEPHEPWSRRVQVSENIHHRTRIEKAMKGRSTFT